VTVEITSSAEVNATEIVSAMENNADENNWVLGDSVGEEDPEEPEVTVDTSVPLLLMLLVMGLIGLVLVLTVLLCSSLQRRKRKTPVDQGGAEYTMPI
jgi:hypothetical protein